MLFSSTFCFLALHTWIFSKPENYHIWFERPSHNHPRHSLCLSEDASDCWGPLCCRHECILHRAENFGVSYLIYFVPWLLFFFMQNFLENSHPAIQSLESLQQRAMDEFSKTASFFGEDGKSTNTEAFFGIFADFMGHFEVRKTQQSNGYCRVLHSALLQSKFYAYDSLFSAFPRIMITSNLVSHLCFFVVIVMHNPGACR